MRRSRRKTHQFGQTDEDGEERLIPEEIAADRRAVEVVSVAAQRSREEHEPQNGDSFEKNRIA